MFSTVLFTTLLETFPSPVIPGTSALLDSLQVWAEVPEYLVTLKEGEGEDKELTSCPLANPATRTAGSLGCHSKTCIFPLTYRLDVQTFCCFISPTVTSSGARSRSWGEQRFKSSLSLQENSKIKFTESCQRDLGVDEVAGTPDHQIVGSQNPLQSINHLSQSVS